jgi:hypothetical protein
LALPGSGKASERGECLRGLASILTVGGFSGSVDCKHDQLTIRRVGSVADRGGQLVIYDYHYRLAPACSECSPHGGQRIIFIRDGRYLGQYKPDAARVAIVARNLVLTPTGQLDPDHTQPISVSLAGGVPPPKVLVDGELLEFFQ